jgi:thiol-disulfide isomerase/thioredoxin
MLPSTKVLALAAAVVLAGAAAIGLAQDRNAPAPGKAPLMTPHMEGRTAQRATPSAPLDKLLSARQWINTEPLRAEDLRGKVVLVNFWTFTCVNWLRTLPYVRAWAEKYKDRGLVVVGVHTPEFSVEKDVANVTRASASLGVGYPVAIDNDYAIWRAFDNYAWPANYFVDASGRVRHHVLGEGSYDLSERWIQQLLSEADGAPAGGGLVTVSPKGPEVAADEQNLESPETYVGYAKATNFLPVGGAREDAPSLYRTPATLPLNYWSLAGVWTIGGESVALGDSRGSIAYRFHSRDVNLVLTAPEGRPVRFRVKIDGAPPAADHGTDVDAEGWGSVQEPRLYQLVRQTRPIEDRTFEIEFLEPGVRAFVFTFG